MQKAPSASVQDIIIHKISELINLGDDFKYSYELNNGLFIINVESSFFEIKILKKINASYEIIRHFKNTAVPSNLIVETIRFDIHITDGYISSNTEYPLNFEKKVELDNAILPIVPYNFKPNILIDKRIMDNITQYVSGTILNRSITTDKMQGEDNQPCELFKDVTATTMVPFDGGVRAKFFSVDKIWSRIIWWDRDRVPCDVCFTSNLAHYNPKSTYTLNRPTDIQYGSPSSSLNGFNSQYGTGRDTTYPLYIADNANNRIVKVDYRLRTKYVSFGSEKEFSIIDESFSQVITSKDYPYGLGVHAGSNAGIGNGSDDVIWFTHGVAKRSLICANASNGTIVTTIDNVTFQGENHWVNPTRLSIYRSPDGQRNILAFIDEVNRNIYFLKLDNEGKLTSSTPAAFCVWNMGTHKPKSISLSSSNNGIGGTEVWVATDGGTGGCGNNCGYMSTFNVRYVGNNPIFVDYLASYWTVKNPGSTPAFKNLNNVKIESGYLDISTMENWDNTYGIRRLKPGIDILQENVSTFCKETNSLALTLKLTNPARIFLKAEYKNGSAAYVVKPLTVNGVSITNNQILLAAGSTTLILGVNINAQDGIEKVEQTDEVPTDKVRITTRIAPQDEDPIYSSNSINREHIKDVTLCYGGGGGCPYLFVHDGDSLRIDNNILHRSEFNEYANEIIEDVYKLNVFPNFNNTDSACTLEIKELNNDYSTFDQLKLIEVDHPIGTEIGVTENKDIVLYFPELVINPDTAFLNDTNVTCELQYDTTCSEIGGNEDDNLDGMYDEGGGEFYSKVMSILRNTFNSVKGVFTKEKKKTTRGTKEVQVDYTIIEDSIAVIMDPQSDGPYIPSVAKRPAGITKAYNTSNSFFSGDKEFARRENRSTVIIPVSNDVVVDSVHVDWDINFSLGYMCTTPIYYGGFNQRNLDLFSATHSQDGDVMTRIELEDETCINLDSLNTISLRFSKSDTPIPEGYVRDYVMVTVGKYENVEGRPLQQSNLLYNNGLPKEYKLGQNFPNPFNPITKVKYELPFDSKVVLKVFDITGREVTTLVNEQLKAGYYESVFNGNTLSSGVYFMRLVAGNYVQTKKMVLMK